MRKRYEDEIEAVVKKNAELIARAQFAVRGSSIYPDATFSLRLSYGAVRGWTASGKTIPPFTDFAGLFARHTGSEPYALPARWLARKESLDLAVTFNFVTDNDIIGGNSGSPVINRKGEVVGLVFDGNIHSLGGDYWFDETLNRTVAVHSSAILQALERVYGARQLVDEIRPDAP